MYLLSNHILNKSYKEDISNEVSRPSSISKNRLSIYTQRSASSPKYPELENHDKNMLSKDRDSSFENERQMYESGPESRNNHRSRSSLSGMRSKSPKEEIIEENKNEDINYQGNFVK